MVKRSTIIKAAATAAGYAAYRILLSRSRRIDFRGKVAVITGGSRGLGLILARHLASEGASVAICARHGDQLARAADELRSLGAVVCAEECDLTQVGEIERFFQAVRTRLGPVDVLINNAGVIQVGPLENPTEDDFEQALAIHLWTPLRCMEQVIHDMRRRGGGRIVNIASIGGKLAVPHLLPYSASKFALVGLSRGYRCELAKDNILVTTVCPGLMRTGSPRNALFKGQHRAEYAWFTISGAWPPASMDADRAASQILRACRDGRAEITLSLPAKLAAAASAVAPELVADLSGLAARMLPQPGGIGEATARGSESESSWAPSLLTLPNERAAVRNNEL
jgi:NAD(P)-dependent dehydrogenase (short-subunit alcohol dehydrogenase family)